LLEMLLARLQGGTSLDTFQRVLLMTDGTVTDILEAHAGEPIRVVILGQEFEPVPREISQLDTDGVECLLHRTVLLQGRASGTTFIHADTLVAPERLPPAVLDGLLRTGKPIGRLLTEERVETFREIVALNYEAAGECASYFGVPPSSTLVYRTYLIFIQGSPAMRITEKFPLSRFHESLARSNPRRRSLL
jgi:chorismate-pyruvate lyase